MTRGIEPARTPIRGSRFFAWLVLLLCPAVMSCAVAAKSDDQSARETVTLEIQSGVMSFADTWSSGTNQAKNIMFENIDDPAARLELERYWYHGTLNAYDIAAGRFPGIAMLDMMAMASLSRAITERRFTEMYGEHAKPMLVVLGELENEIWSFSERYLDDSQRQAMRELVEDWLDAHPNARSASFVRFSDFGELGRKPTLEAAVKKGGFLSPIRDAAESAQQFKELAERALFLGIRMQELMLGRAEVMGQSLLNSDEVGQLLDDVHGFRLSAERYASVAEHLPERVEKLVVATMDEVTEERTAAIQQALEGIAAERSATLDQVMTGVRAERERTIEQVMTGIQAERLGILKATAQVFYWAELSLRATTTRLLIIVACLIILWFGLRLVYRYWVDRVANNFLKTLGVMALLIVLAAPIVAVGLYFVNMIEPDFSKQGEFMVRMSEALDKLHGEPPQSASPDASTDND